MQGPPRDLRIPLRLGRGRRGPAGVTLRCEKERQGVATFCLMPDLLTT